MRAPSAWNVAAWAISTGALLGAGVPAVRAAMQPWRLGEFDPAGLRIEEGVAVPEVDAPTTQFAFGTMSHGSEQGHEFVIRNAGEAPLKITRGATSCSCTVSDFESSEGGETDGEKFLAPGGATKVRLKWRGKNPGPFRQQATVFTNDPRRPEIVFVVEGFVVPLWKAKPESIVLTGITSQGGTKASANIFTYGKEPLTVAGVGTPDPETAQFVSFTTKPLPADEIANERGATDGVTLEVEILPGVPLGPLRKTIQIDLRLPEPAVAEVVVEGTVVGDLALTGPGWDSSRQVLQLGTISGRTGVHTQMFITAKGAHRDAVRPTVRSVVPSSMKVEVGEGKALGSGAVVRIPLSISIPAGSPPCNHLGSTQAPAGRIVLDTGHPESPTMTIPVCVAVGP